MKSASFLEILGQKMEAQLRQELQKELQPKAAKAPAQSDVTVDFANMAQVELQMSLQMQPFSFVKSTYKPAPRKPHTLSPEQGLAQQLFTSLGAELPIGFNARELRRMFRVLAIKTHADQGGSDSLFLQVRQAFKTLNQLFHTDLPR